MTLAHDTHPLKNVFAPWDHLAPFSALSGYKPSWEQQGGMPPSPFFGRLRTKSTYIHNNNNTIDFYSALHKTITKHFIQALSFSWLMAQPHFSIGTEAAECNKVKLHNYHGIWWEGHNVIFSNFEQHGWGWCGKACQLYHLLSLSIISQIILA